MGGALGTLKCLTIGKFVGQAHPEVRVLLLPLEVLAKPQPRATAAGAQIHHLASSASVHRAAQLGHDRPVEIAHIPNDLQGVGDKVAQKGRKPRMVVNLDQFDAGHGFLVAVTITTGNEDYHQMYTAFWFYLAEILLC
jgi:hypothetical protein